MERLNLLFILCHSLIIFNFKFRIVEGIVGGVDVEPGDYKFMVSVQADGVHVCGGAIIEEGHALTAAHCVIGMDNQFKRNKFTLLGGVYNLNNLKEGDGIRISVSKIFVPAHYKRATLEPDKTFYNELGDIAILKFQKRLTFPHLLLSKADFPIRILPNRYMKYFQFSATVIGFGSDMPFERHLSIQRDRNNVIIQRLHGFTMKSDLTKVTHKNTCRSIISFVPHENHLCAKVEQKSIFYPEGTCNGDGGGPLIVEKNTIIGILAQHTKDCNEQYAAGLYTRVTTYISLINRVLRGKITSEVRTAEAQIINTDPGFLEEETLVESLL